MDEVLLARARRGDPEAFSALAASVVDRMYAVATLILRDRSRAEDATQEALLRAWRSLPSLRRLERFSAWLDRILVNACMDQARGRSIGSEHGLAALPDRATERWTDAIADRELLERAFRRIQPAQRAVLVLRHYLSLTVPEIAETLGIPEGTAKSRIHHATRVLRAAVDADERAVPDRSRYA